MSLVERAADFTRVFPNKKISSTTLSRIYKKNKVRKKKVKVTKIPTKKERAKIKKTTYQAKEELEYYRSRGFRIIYLDETMVTKSTIATHDWSAKNQNYKIDMKSFGKESIAVLAAISKEYGIDHTGIYNKSVNIPKFKEFLQNLRDKYFFEDICIYLDNLAVHRRNEVRQRLDELSIPCISVLPTPQTIIQ